MNDSTAVSEGKNLAQMVDEYFVLGADVKAKEDELSAAKEKREKAMNAVIDALENSGLKQMKDANGRIVFLQEPRIYGSINKENRDAAVKFLKKSWKLGYAFKEELSASTLGRVIKERLAKGLPVPEEFVTYHAKRQLGHRGAGAEKE